LAAADIAERRKAIVTIIEHQVQSPKLFEPLTAIATQNGDPQLAEMASAARFVANPNEFTLIDDQVIPGLARVATTANSPTVRARALETIGWYFQAVVEIGYGEVRNIVVRRTLTSESLQTATRALTSGLRDEHVDVRRSAALSLFILLRNFTIVGPIQKQAIIIDVQPALELELRDPDRLVRGFAKVGLRRPVDDDVKTAGAEFKKRGERFFGSNPKNSSPKK
jgi:hypothetical protein